MKKNNKPAAKRYMKTVGMVMASVMVLSSTTGQMVYAETAKDQKDRQDGEKKEEKITGIAAVCGIDRHIFCDRLWKRQSG